MNITPKTPFFVFDVESIGLHGQHYAVAGGVFIEGKEVTSFCYACNPSYAVGEIADRNWCKANIPPIPIGMRTPRDVSEAFWHQWLIAKDSHPNIVMAAECGWPVEARFLNYCVDLGQGTRNWEGPYPLHEIASFMAAAGMDPMATYDRLENELTKHHPLADARQSARLLHEALVKLHIQSPPPQTPPTP